MEYMIATFRSRTETINFANILRSYKVNVLIISTPRQINVSCGISVKFNAAYEERAREILSRRKFDSFGGLYLTKYIGGKVHFIKR